MTFDAASQQHVEVNREVIDELVKRGTVQEGDMVIITKGDLMGIHGATNTMKIIRVGDY